MKGPIRLIRSNKISEYENLGSFYEWSEGKAYLMIDRARFREKEGAILCYYNPPVHQVGNPGLDAYLEGLDKLFEEKGSFKFLVLYGANDPVHAGGDLKESLKRLDDTLERKKEKEEEGAPPEEIDRLYDWADNRLRKGMALHKSLRTLARHMRVVAVCGGGTRFGGSAEIPLMADYLVGDSRSGMCFSEAMIGLIPGWAGIARTLVKAGMENVEYMAKTSREAKAEQLLDIGIYNEVVQVPFPFPRREKTDQPEADKENYLKALETHNDETGLLLVPRGLALATCPIEDIPVVQKKGRKILAPKKLISQEVARRRNPETYSNLWGKPLREVKDDISKMGRPLAPQSVEALTGLLAGYDPSNFDEEKFVEKEMLADARLYRDPKFRAGLIATLEQRVPDFREAT